MSEQKKPSLAQPTADSNTALPLHALLDSLRQTAMTEREKGTYFENLVMAWLRHEPAYRDRYKQVWTWAEWAPQNGFTGKDDGIDLVAEEAGSGAIHAIQCKFYARDYKVRKEDIDSFFTASGRKPFAHRLIITTTNHWSEHAENALRGQQLPVSKITLHDLEASQIDWARFQPGKAVSLKAKKSLRPHQDIALNAVLAGLQKAERGKLIMACGTGKTYTSLKIAEKMAGKGGRVLFLVPSLSLLSQTLTEWTQESDVPLHSFAVCSDSDVGKKQRQGDDDGLKTFVHELRFPATTNGSSLAKGVANRYDAEHMTVVFSTYHSIETIHHAQQQHGLADFDLIICDEAHRTTGATYEGDDESAFVRVHDAGYIRAKKRLYMTATPRIYGDSAKAVAERDNVALYSMDNAEWYGEELHVINFSEAVQRGLLVDYKVIVLAVEESHINRKLQGLLADDSNSLRVDDAAKIVGCWKALAKIGMQGTHLDGDDPMKRAVAFCQVIEPNKHAKTHKISSKEISDMFQAVVDAYQEAEDIEDEARLTCEAWHVDGSMNAGEKEERLSWLKESTPDNTCRILSNVRCLSEGVDVPALDAVLFLTPRNSQVDVVQSVGRVMRNAPGKKMGYVVLPVVIPAGVEPHEALNDNKTYAVVWQVLQALRSHDDRFDAMINKLDLNGPDHRKMEVIAISDKMQRKVKSAACSTGIGRNGRGQHTIGEPTPHYGDPAPKQLQFEYEVGEIERALYAKVVEKCGNRHHWEDWANDIAKIARTHIDRIKATLESDKNAKAQKAFSEFAAELRDDINDQVSNEDIIEMLAQHLITKPVFEALFSDYSFASSNPMSQAMQTVLDALEEEHLEKETASLRSFYNSVKMRAEGITNPAGKQRIIVELYDKFFRNAFPRMTERLGIVYTPVEVVDFILKSVNDLLQKEFQQTIGNNGVHVLDPFTGTGTFITRLLQSGLIKPEELEHKYRHEIHANEIVLLAYYIAAINIEATYHGLVGGDYVPFSGICLTDTFQMGEKEDLVDAMLEDNSKRRKNQKTQVIRVIVGNPPYSVGQNSANDNNANIRYPALDQRIRSTYAARSSATLKNSLYDSYIRAIRWASDRIGDAGIIGFVTNAGFLDANTADGLRKCLVDEFSSLYVFHLRGNQRTSGELSRKEGGKIFGVGSRAPIAISLLVKNPAAPAQGQIRFHDIGDYLTREDKLKKIADYGSISRIKDWLDITPDAHGDWLNQRDDSFGKFIALGSKDDANHPVLFSNYSNGVKTNRDAWVYNASRTALESTIQEMIGFYNSEVQRYAEACEKSLEKTRPVVDDFIEYDDKKISWTHEVKEDLKRHNKRNYIPEEIVKSIYRPFSKTWMYFDRHFNNRVYRMPLIYPLYGGTNTTICLTGRGSSKDFDAIMTDLPTDLELISKNQCFPQFLYEGAPAAIAASSEQRAASSEQRAASSEQRAASSEQRAASSEYTGSQPDSAGKHSGESDDLPDVERNEGLFRDDDELRAGPSPDRRRAMLPDVPVRQSGGSRMSSNGQLGLFGDNQEQPSAGNVSKAASASPAGSSKQTASSVAPSTSSQHLKRREAITDAGLKHFQDAYPGEAITKEDLFYYIYGILHSPDYRKCYEDNLSKELPRIPRVKTFDDFRAFTEAGRKLGALHVGYEQADMYPLKIDSSGALTDADYRVEKMRFAKKKDPATGRSVDDRSTVIYNSKITISGIPAEAWDYVVNGKAALDWVMERQAVRTDKASGIVNDANDWATETMGNPRYPLELFQRIVTVSLETTRIVAGLPPLDIHDDG